MLSTGPMPGARVLPGASKVISSSTRSSEPPAYATADEVIAEMKLLAKSMLEQSQEARRRVLLDGDSSSSAAAVSSTIPRNTLSAADSKGAAAERKTTAPAPQGPPASSAALASDLRDAELLRRLEVGRTPSLESFDVFEDEDDELDLTLTCFKPGEGHLFDRMVAALWLPEPVSRNADGSFAGRWSVSSPSAAEPSDPKPVEETETPSQSRPYKRRTQSFSASEVDTIQTYRVPLFPYGGGVTGQQLKALTLDHERCGKQTSARHGEPPALIRKKAFLAGDYPEVTPWSHRCVPTAGSSLSTTGKQEVFSPQSLWDFVVEVERSVQFDPAKARKERQEEFKRKLKEKKAKATMGTFNLKVIMDPTRTGFEDETVFPIHRGTIIADRYEIAQLIAKSTFSRTVRCYDLEQPIYEEEDEEEEETSGKPRPPRHPIGYHEVCIKVIHNSKEFFDQSLDEIRLLRLLNENMNPDRAHVLRLIDAFYYKEHCMLVTELLSDSLYEYHKYNREEEDGKYFTIPRLKRITRQVMEALAYVHSLNLIHADLKPENILFVSHRNCIVKVIDFGSSSFLSDHLSSYIQSRNYRAPEVILGCDYDGRIDVWSYGAILMELILGEVYFFSSTVPEMLARMVVECGSPLPRRMLWEGRNTHNFVTKFGAIYEVSGNGSGRPTASTAAGGREEEGGGGEECYYVYSPHPKLIPPPPPASASEREQREYAYVYHHKDGSFVQLRSKLLGAGVTDEVLTDFIEKCLTLDHRKRATTAELLEHPFIADVRV